METVAVGAPKRVRYIMGLVALSMLALVVVIVGLPDRIAYYSKFKTGDMVVSKVESFRTQHQRLPETLDEVGISDPDLPVYYQQENDGNDYIVWFGTTLGESIVYHSTSHKWD